jgi:hypothetical protein
MRGLVVALIVVTQALALVLGVMLVMLLGWFGGSLLAVAVNAIAPFAVASLCETRFLGRTSINPFIVAAPVWITVFATTLAFTWPGLFVSHDVINPIGPAALIVAAAAGGVLGTH